MHEYYAFCDGVIGPLVGQRAQSQSVQKNAVAFCQVRYSKPGDGNDRLSLRVRLVAEESLSDKRETSSFEKSAQHSAIKLARFSVFSLYENSHIHFHRLSNDGCKRRVDRERPTVDSGQPAKNIDAQQTATCEDRHRMKRRHGSEELGATDRDIASPVVSDMSVDSLSHEGNRPKP